MYRCARKKKRPWGPWSPAHSIFVPQRHRKIVEKGSFFSGELVCWIRNDLACKWAKSEVSPLYILMYSGPIRPLSPGHTHPLGDSLHCGTRSACKPDKLSAKPEVGCMNQTPARARVACMQFYTIVCDFIQFFIQFCVIVYSFWLLVCNSIQLCVMFTAPIL